MNCGNCGERLTKKQIRAASYRKPMPKVIFCSRGCMMIARHKLARTAGR